MMVEYIAVSGLCSVSYRCSVCCLGVLVYRLLVSPPM